jgi:hypothetical protein
MRLIDADKIPYTDLSDGRGLCWVTFIEKVDKMPTIDAVPVVRCKDCVYYNKDVQNFNGYYRCDRYALWQSEDERVHMPLDGFCNYGEKEKR